MLVPQVEDSVVDHCVVDVLEDGMGLGAVEDLDETEDLADAEDRSAVVDLEDTERLDCLDKSWSVESPGCVEMLAMRDCSCSRVDFAETARLGHG